MIYSLGDRVPEVHPTAWVAPGATVVGQVRLEADSSVWFGAVIRGDTDPIVIGTRSNVQEGAVLHADPGFPCTLGDGVTVGHLAMVHGCTVCDGSLIGIHAVVLNGARIGRGCIVGAGAVVAEGQEIPDGSLVLGVPGRVVRPVRPEQRARAADAARIYIEKARRFREGLRPVTP